MFVLLLTELTCTRMSLHLTDGIQVIPGVYRYSFQEMAIIWCKSGFIGTAVRARCIGVSKWSQIPPICTSKILLSAISTQNK